METETQAEAVDPATNGNGGSPEPEDQPEVKPERSMAERQSATEMFRFSEYVHVGPGAAECEEAEAGTCANPLHFHAWCRMPNQFQQSSIREKALAAKARKARQLRDGSSDGHEILEAEMDSLLRIGTDSGTQSLVEEIIAQSFWKDHLTAVRELGEEEEWATIREDQERIRHLASLPVDQRPADEFAELEAHMKAYDEAVQEKRQKNVQPLRDALEQKSVEELVGQIRESRIETEANEDFMRTFSLWQIYIGTMKIQPQGMPEGKPSVASERVFSDVNHLQQAAPEVVEALEATFGELEAALGARSAVGNL